MSIWMFFLLLFCSLLPLGIGINILETCDHKKQSYFSFNGLLGIFFLIGGFSIIGYGIYKCFIFDYSKSIEKAIVKHDYEKAHELLFDMSQDSEETREISVWGERHKSKYKLAFDKVFKSELTYLLNQGDRQASDRLISLVGNLPIEATPTIGITDNKQTQKKNEDYSRYAGKFNGICDDILNNAISTGNKYLAEKILVLYKPTLVRTLEESNLFSTDAYRYTYTNEMQIAARKRFDEAVHTGAFP